MLKRFCANGQCTKILPPDTVKVKMKDFKRLSSVCYYTYEALTPKISQGTISTKYDILSLSSTGCPIENDVISGTVFPKLIYT